MELYSHRGIGLGKENSLTSIQEAKKRGIKYEADVRKSADNELVLWHDTGLVENRRYSELEKLGIGRLKDALQMDVSLDLDIKESAKGIDVLKMVEQHDQMEQVLFTSFDYLKIKEIKQANPDAKVGLITEQDQKLSYYVLPIIKDKMNIILPHADTVNKTFIESAHNAGLQVITWAPSTERIKKNNETWGVDGMILDL